MKYESELIKEIVDSRGHEKSSLHYQSECVESWIEEAKGGYPKLYDYESEWLNYIVENPIGHFPYVVLSDVTKATVNNVVPYAYKSAILKGNTLINLADGCEHNVTVNNTAWGRKIVALNNIKNNTTYTMKVETQQIVASSFTPNVEVRLKGGNYAEASTTGGVIKFTSGDEVYETHLRLVVTGANPESSNINFKVVVLEGDYTNIDIPYFTGMQSVKMPVLTTTGKNLFDGNLINGYYEDDTLNKIIEDNTNLYKTIKLNLKRGTYTFSFEESVRFIRQLKDGVYGILDGDFTNFTTTLNTDGIYVLSFRKTDNTDFDLTKIQIEEGSVATAYEPYKSNILTVNEEMELRGIGDMKDELNVITGEVTKRFEEINLSELQTGFYTQSAMATDCYSFYYNPQICKPNGKALCNNLPTLSKINEGEGIYISATGRINLNIKSNKMTDSSLNSFMNYLTNNPTIIQYELPTESIKTVDLSITNQDGNTLTMIKPIEGTMYLSTSSETINPLFSGEIPIEAITQNLSSFIEVE